MSHGSRKHKNFSYIKQNMFSTEEGWFVVVGGGILWMNEGDEAKLNKLRKFTYTKHEHK